MRPRQVESGIVAECWLILYTRTRNIRASGPFGQVRYVCLHLRLCSSHRDAMTMAMFQCVAHVEVVAKCGPLPDIYRAGKAARSFSHIAKSADSLSAPAL